MPKLDDEGEGVGHFRNFYLPFQGKDRRTISAEEQAEVLIAAHKELAKKGYTGVRMTYSANTGQTIQIWKRREEGQPMSGVNGGNQANVMDKFENLLKKPGNEEAAGIYGGLCPMSTMLGSGDDRANSMKPEDVFGADVRQELQSMEEYLNPPAGCKHMILGLQNNVTVNTEFTYAIAGGIANSQPHRLSEEYRKLIEYRLRGFARQFDPADSALLSDFSPPSKAPQGQPPRKNASPEAEAALKAFPVKEVVRSPFSGRLGEHRLPPYDRINELTARTATLQKSIDSFRFKGGQKGQIETIFQTRSNIFQVLYSYVPTDKSTLAAVLQFDEMLEELNFLDDLMPPICNFAYSASRNGAQDVAEELLASMHSEYKRWHSLTSNPKQPFEEFSRYRDRVCEFLSEAKDSCLKLDAASQAEAEEFSLAKAIKLFGFGSKSKCPFQDIAKEIEALRVKIIESDELSQHAAAAGRLYPRIVM